jgi:DNA-binding PadR family transcriptional regulator
VSRSSQAVVATADIVLVVEYSLPAFVLQLGQGALYPALYRLERQGLIRSDWT